MATSLQTLKPIHLVWRPEILQAVIDIRHVAAQVKVAVARPRQKSAFRGPDLHFHERSVDEFPSALLDRWGTPDLCVNHLEDNPRVHSRHLKQLKCIAKFSKKRIWRSPDKPANTYPQTQRPPHRHHHHLELTDNQGVKVGVFP